MIRFEAAPQVAVGDEHATLCARAGDRSPIVARLREITREVTREVATLE